MIADFYNCNPEGVVNNRHKFPFSGDTTPPIHHDFTTPEYQAPDSIADKKWETCRGIGLSFGYNRTEDVSEFLSVDELVDSFVDIVSKNGNLLLNVGPQADGTIPAGQRTRLEGLSNWLAGNGEAIFGSRPWTQAEAVMADGDRVRFARRGNAIYAILLDEPHSNKVVIDVSLPNTTSVSALPDKQPLTYRNNEEGLTLELPTLPRAPAYAFKIGTAPAR